MYKSGFSPPVTCNTIYVVRGATSTSSSPSTALAPAPAVRASKAPTAQGRRVMPSASVPTSPGCHCRYAARSMTGAEAYAALSTLPACPLRVVSCALAFCWPEDKGLRPGCCPCGCCVALTPASVPSTALRNNNLRAIAMPRRALWPQQHEQVSGEKEIAAEAAVPQQPCPVPTTYLNVLTAPAASTLPLSPPCSTDAIDPARLTGLVLLLTRSSQAPCVLPALLPSRPPALPTLALSPVLVLVLALGLSMSIKGTL